MRATLASALALLALAGCGGTQAVRADAPSTKPKAKTPAEATATPTAAPARTSARGLHVKDNQLVDGRGRQVLFHGVNRSGTEYACVQKWGFSDGPNSVASVRAIKQWGVNAVRVPINEQCWLQINGIGKRYSGARYRREIVRYVSLLQR